MTPFDDPQISYGVKTLLEDIKQSLTRIDVKLDKKADREEVIKLATAMERLDHRVADLETVDRDAKNLETFKANLRKRSYAAATLFVSISIALAAYIHYAGG